MLLAAGGLGAFDAYGCDHSWLLLTLTFALGLGAAMNAPAWQAIIPELITGSEVRAAVTLNGVGYNLRARSDPRWAD